MAAVIQIKMVMTHPGITSACAFAMSFIVGPCLMLSGSFLVDFDGMNLP